jgi:RNA polymerase sigma-70 factor, ECF subfamily
MCSFMQFDAKFIQKLKKGDKKCFERLFLSNYESLCEYSISITGSKEDSEGAVQDVFAGLWQNRFSIEDDTNIRAYLFKSAKNRSLDIIQHRDIRQKYQKVLTAMYQNTAENSPETTSRLIQRVRQEVENLPEKSKIVYLLHRRDGLSYAEIAEILDISVKAVEARMTKALKILRARLENETDLNLIPFLALLAI